MRKRTWRRSSSPAVLAVVLTLGVPALVQAQTQLFPLAPIQRQRVTCPMEDPVYGLYRQKYYGYFPTCWRAYPPGWGCPSPEAPVVAREFEKRKRDALPKDIPLEPDFGPGTEGAPGDAPGLPRGRGGVSPPLPSGGRSPFELDPPGATGPGDRMPAPDPRGGGGALPPQALRTSPSARSLTARRNQPPAAAPDEKGNASEGAAPLLALPDPVETTTTPTPSAGGAGSDPVGQNGTPPTPLVSPSAAAGLLPTLPEPGVTQQVVNPSPMPPATMETPDNFAPVVPVQAPQRRGPISSLFNGMTSWMRR